MENSSIGQAEGRSLTCGEYCSKVSDCLDQLRTDMGIPDWEYQIMIAQAINSTDRLSAGDYSRARTYISHKLGIDSSFKDLDDFAKILLAQRKVFESIHSRSK